VGRGGPPALLSEERIQFKEDVRDDKGLVNFVGGIPQQEGVGDLRQV
jgi:hypothetical protein